MVHQNKFVLKSPEAVAKACGRTYVNSRRIRQTYLYITDAGQACCLKETDDREGHHLTLVYEQGPNRWQDNALLRPGTTIETPITTHDHRELLGDGRRVAQINKRQYDLGIDSEGVRWQVDIFLRDGHTFALPYFAMARAFFTPVMHYHQLHRVNEVHPFVQDHLDPSVLEPDRIQDWHLFYEQVLSRNRPEGGDL